MMKFLPLLFLLGVVAAGFLLIRHPSFNPKVITSATITSAPPAFPSLPALKKEPTIIDNNTETENYHFYTLGDNGFKEIYAAQMTLGRHYGSAEPFMSGQTVYYADREKVFSYNLSNYRQQTLYNTLDPKGEISYISLSDNSNLLYVNKAVSDEAGTKDELTLSEFNLKTSQQRIIPKIPVVTFGRTQYLFSARGVDIAGSFGGDGCGGYGKIYRLAGSTPVEIIKTGSGCDEDPRFLGIDSAKGEVLLYSISSYEMTDPVSSERLDKLYWQNVLTGQKVTVYDFKSQDQSDAQFVLNEDKSKIALFKNMQVTVVNLADMTTEKTVPITDLNFGYPTKWLGDKIYSYDYGNNAFKVLNLTTGEVKNYSWENVFYPVGNSPRILGEKDGQAVIFAATN